MINIEESRLLDILSRRRKFFKTKWSFLELFLSLASILVSILLTNFAELSFLKQVLICTLCGFIAVVVIHHLITYNYSADKLYKEILSAASNDHNFSLIIIQNNKRQFLLKYDNRWGCYLFPYQKTNLENDNQAVSLFVKSIGCNDFEIGTPLKETVTKHSVSANLEKTYLHTFYPITIKSDFSFDKSKYKWFSYDEMKEDPDINEKNSETIDFVYSHF